MVAYSAKMEPSSKLIITKVLLANREMVVVVRFRVVGI